MYPVINIFGREFTTYAICALVGIFVSGILMCKVTRSAGKDDNDTIILLLVSSIGVLIGGHILYGLTNIKHFYIIFEATDIKSFFSAATTIFGGSVFYGGLIGGIAFALAYSKITRKDITFFADIAGFGVPLFHAFARMGCFFVGCCYGVESKFGFTASGNKFVDAVNGINRFPVQILEAVCNVLIFVLIYCLYQRGKQKGYLFIIYLSLYSIVRFFDEFLRGDEIRGFILGISTSQFISICVLVVSLIVLIYRKKTLKIHDKGI